MQRKLLVLAPFDSSAIEKIKNVLPEDFIIKHFPEELPEDRLLSEIKDAEIVIGEPPLRIIQNVDERCPKLSFIQMTWAGTDIYTRSSLEFPKDRIMLANASGIYGGIMSQYVIGMTLAIMLNFQVYHKQQQNKIWERRGPIRSLENAKVLIFGAGDIGKSIAKRLSGFDAYCIGVCRDTKVKREYFDELCTLDEAEKYISQSDVIIGCIPNTAETAGYMNSHRLSLMKRDAVIVNVGRGNFIDCDALDVILRKGDIWGAALDVTNPEPLPANHPLWENSRCMITPHVSGVTFGHLKETEELLVNLVCDNLTRYCGEKDIKNRIF